MAIKITTEEIIAKYPKIFEDYPGNPGRCNWHGVPTGWLPIIDDLCGSIQEYIDHHRHSIDNPDYIEGSTWNYDDITTHKSIMVSHDQVTCTQMKEKFGGLRFYENGADKIVDGMIHYAEYLADNTCQDCGSREDLGRTSGWISTICRTCAIGNGDRAMAAWKSKNE
jgi:hypothetical protein